jgi:hypothetical protein
MGVREVQTLGEVLQNAFPDLLELLCTAPIDIDAKALADTATVS